MAAQIRTDDIVVVRGNHADERQVEPGLTRKVLAYNEKMFLAEHHLTEGWVGAIHSHPHEQMVYVVSGHVRVSCQGEIYELKAGDSFVVRGNVPHGAAALADSVLLDVFTPCREDYIV